jgi:hypothetical protein
MKEGLIYLSTPYTGFLAGDREAAYRMAVQVTGKLQLGCMDVFSPIVHGHPLRVWNGSEDQTAWLAFNQTMMNLAVAQIIAHMPGWDTSEGVSRERDSFIRAGKPIYDLDPMNIGKVTRRRNPLVPYIIDPILGGELS